MINPGLDRIESPLDETHALLIRINIELRRVLDSIMELASTGTAYQEGEIEEVIEFFIDFFGRYSYTDMFSQIVISEVLDKINNDSVLEDIMNKMYMYLLLYLPKTEHDKYLDIVESLIELYRASDISEQHKSLIPTVVTYKEKFDVDPLDVYKRVPGMYVLLFIMSDPTVLHE